MKTSFLRERHHREGIIIIIFQHNNPEYISGLPFTGLYQDTFNFKITFIINPMPFKRRILTAIHVRCYDISFSEERDCYSASSRTKSVATRTS